MLKNFYKQYLSNNPDISINENIKVLLRMSKGFLVIGALTSMSFTIPTIYSLLIPLFDSTTSVVLTIISAFLIFFIIDLSIGSLTPFTLDFTFSKKIKNNSYSLFGGLLLWTIILFLAFTSMYLTFNGAKIPVINSIEIPESHEIVEMEQSKSEAIQDEEQRYKSLYLKTHKQDSLNLLSLKKKFNTQINKEKKESRKNKLIQDSIIKVSDMMNNQKSEYYLKEMTSAINDTRNSWNQLIIQKKEEHDRNLNIYETRINATLLIVQILGVISTLLFFLIQIVVILLKYSDTEKNDLIKNNRKEERFKRKHDINIDEF
jgi:hypothetical protein